MDNFVEGVLLLDDGTFYKSLTLMPQNVSGSKVFGEICFNTAFTGYQEIVSDPSYRGQIIVYTFTHIGNVGCNENDVESISYMSEFKNAKAMVVRNLPTNYSNHRGVQNLFDFCKQNQITLFIGADTRAITKKITSKTLRHGNAVIACNVNEGNIKQLYDELLLKPSMNGAELTFDIYPKPPRFFENGKISNSITKRDWAKNLAVIDFGIKENILNLLEQNDFDIQIFPHDVSFSELENFDAYFLSNGPGDPRPTYSGCKTLIDAIVKSKKPVFGICLGHQMLSLSLGLAIEKMPQGHRGANQPVKNFKTGLVEITSQNHGFAVSEKSPIPPHITITHRSLFDGVIEGFETKDGKILSIQYHPESSPGPHDSRYLFTQFRAMVG